MPPAPDTTSASDPGRVEVGGSPVDVAAGDLDGDGRTDLVSADAEGHRISVLLRRGEGWAAADPVLLDLPPHLVALADVDRDRDLDLLATAHDSGAVWVWLGEGGGRFAPTPGSPFPGMSGSKPHNHGLAVGDLDGDGDPDVVVTDQDARAAMVLLNDGQQPVTLSAGSPVALGAAPYPPALGDLDRDGRTDLLAPLVGGQAITVLLGDGRGGFRAGPGSPHRSEFPRPYGLALGDLDGDGALDVIASHDDTDRVTVLLGDGRGGLRPAPGSPVALGHRVGTRLALADLDWDGHLDLAGAGGGTLVVAHGDGRGGLGRIRNEPLGEGWAVVAADLDGDGRPDLAATDMAGGALRLFFSGPRERR